MAVLPSVAALLLPFGMAEKLKPCGGPERRTPSVAVGLREHVPQGMPEDARIEISRHFPLGVGQRPVGVADATEQFRLAVRRILPDLGQIGRAQGFSVRARPNAQNGAQIVVSCLHNALP